MLNTVPLLQFRYMARVEDLTGGMFLGQVATASVDSVIVLYAIIVVI